MSAAPLAGGFSRRGSLLSIQRHLTLAFVQMQSAGEAELQAVINAGCALSEAVLSSTKERQAQLADVAGGPRFAVRPSRLPRAPRDWSPSSQRSQSTSMETEAKAPSAFPRWQSGSPLKLQMPEVNSLVARDADKHASGSGNWLLAAEHGSPIARPAPTQQ